MTVAIGGRLEASDVVAVAGGAPVSFGDDARARVAAARVVIDDAVASGATIYGVTTGFGALAHTRVDPAQASTLQHGIVRSHATAVGTPLPREEARAMLLLRAHVLALGHSGVRPEVVDLMVSMLNEDVIPAVPQQGSLGASGDLAPLANLALPLIGHGEVLAPEGGTEPAAGCDGPRRALAADARGEGRTRPRERHPGHARDRHPGDRARRDARTNRRRRRGDDDRGVARHRPSLRRAAAGAAAAPRTGRECFEPPPAAVLVSRPRLPPGVRAPRAGRVLAAVRAAGARRDPRRARVRERCARDRDEQRERQPDRAARRRRGHESGGTSTASRWRSRSTPWRPRSSRSRRSPSAASTACSTSISPTGCRRSSCTARG